MMKAKGKNTPRLALTLGEPAGIGPDICIKMAQKKLPGEVVVVGSSDLLYARAKLLNLPLTLYELNSRPVQNNGEGTLAIVDIKPAAPCVPGKLNSANNDYVRKTLDSGYQLCADQICDALVTGPIHKAIMNQDGYAFSGHTEYFAKLAKVDNVLMVFYTPPLIVALVTTHCPLNKVSSLITPQRLTKAIEILQHGLIHLFKKPNPIISICGINPHAGEGGLLGSEEQNVVIPVIKHFQEKGLKLLGPLPADTAFTPKNRGAVDAILAMYHDQALAPIKALFFGDIVNITLGLPFLRTSVDHGTALDLAGTNQADESSLIQAVQVAAQFCFGH
ncbi:MAG: 4-hydroxythreonine-4-phosphate dehydrogenase PdxA [Candidatus Berkiellales bacterium]